MAVGICKLDVTGATEDELWGQSAASTPCIEQIDQSLRAFLGSEGLILPHSWVGSAVKLGARSSFLRPEQREWEELSACTGKNPHLTAVI